MSERKRKAAAADTERPAKIPHNAATVTVSHVDGPDFAKPAIVTLPGVTFPSNLKFNSFNRVGHSELILQSSDHPTIDYTAVESQTANSTEKHLKHYVAVFDPATGKLQVTEARRMTVRSCVRQLEPASDSADDPEAIKPVSNYSSRSALTAAFGTKKSRKAVQAMAENRLLARGGDDKDNPLSTAILGDAEDDDEAMESTESPHAHRVNKPLPEVNMETDDINEVYALQALVFPKPNTTLTQMPIGDWRDRVSSKKEIKTHYRYIANRVGYLAKAHLASPSDETLLLKLQLLRYIQLLFEIAKYSSQHARHRPIRSPTQWPEGTTTDKIPIPILSSLTNHFFPNKLPTTHNITRLRATILALTLHIPPPSLNPGIDLLVSEPTDIALDLALPTSEVSKLYRELGCKMEYPRDSEIERWGLQKVMSARKSKNADGKETSAPKVKFAKLSFPIEFPKISQGRRERR